MKRRCSCRRHHYWVGRRGSLSFLTCLEKSCLSLDVKVFCCQPCTRPILPHCRTLASKARLEFRRELQTKFRANHPQTTHTKPGTRHEALTVSSFSMSLRLADSSARIAAFCFTSSSFRSISCLTSVSCEKDSERICASRRSGLGCAWNDFCDKYNVSSHKSNANHQFRKILRTVGSCFRTWGEFPRDISSFGLNFCCGVLCAEGAAKAFAEAASLSSGTKAPLFPSDLADSFEVLLLPSRLSRVSISSNSGPRKGANFCKPSINEILFLPV